MALNGAMHFGLIFRARSNLAKILRQDVTALRGLDLTSKGATASIARLTTSVKALALGASAFALTAFFSRSIGLAGDFENQLQRTRIVTQDAFQSNMMLGNSLIAVSNETGRAGVNLAKLTEIAGNAGLAAQFGAEGFVDFTEIAAKLSKVSLLTPAQTSTLLARSFTQLGLQSLPELRRLASALQAVGKNSLSGTAEVAGFLQQLAPFRKTLGFTTAELLALAGSARAFGNVSKELLTTKIPKFFQETRRNLPAVAKGLGKSQQQLRALINNNPFEFFKQFLGFVKQFRGRQADLGETFDSMGIKSQRLFRIIAGGSGQIGTMNKMLKIAQADLSGVSNTLERDFAMAMDTFNSQLERFQVILMNISVLAGSSFLRPLTLLLRVINAIMVGLTAFLQTDIGQMTASLLGIASVAGSIWAIFKAIVAIANFTGLSAFLGTFVEIGGSIVGMLAGGLAILLAVSAVFTGIGSILNAALGSGLARAVTLIGLIREGVGGFIKDGEITLDLWNKLHKEGILNIVLSLTRMVERGRAFAAGFMEPFQGFLSGIDEPFKSLVDEFFDLLDTLGLIDRELGFTTDTWRDLGRIAGFAIKGAAMNLINFIITPIKGLILLVRGFISLLRGAAGIVRTVGRAFGFGGVSEDALLRATSAPETGALPLTSSMTPEGTGEAIKRLAEAAAEGRAGGAAAGPGGLLANLHIKTESEILLDGEQVGSALSRAGEQKRLRSGGLRGDAAGASGFGSEFDAAFAGSGF